MPLVVAVVSPEEETVAKVTVTPLPAETLTLFPEGVLGEIFATKASPDPIGPAPPKAGWKVPAVVGKFVELV